MATVMESHVFGEHLWDFANDGRIQSRKVCPHGSRAAHSSKRTTYQVGARGGQDLARQEEMNDTTIRKTDLQV